ncbi:MAG TPA: LpqB family beta-propeller domain-containing protein [Acetobacteraceae bacterium]
MPDIFLSYSRDDQATARLFAEGFEREGFSVWWDATLNPGEAFDQVTEKALREAKAVVVLWTKKSVDSRWVRAEAMQANDNKTLVPVMIEPCKRPIMFELTHTADLSQWTGDRKDAAWQSFVAGVRLFVERGGPVPAALPAAGTSRASVSPVMRASLRGVGTGRRTTIAALVALGVAIVGMAVLAVPAIRYLRETPPPETRLEIGTPATDDPASFALSPDGRQIVFVAAGDGASRLWLRPLATTTAQPLAGTEGATSPFWSPDSRSIGFFADGALKRLDLGGGAPQTLAPVSIQTGGTWNAGGVILFAQSTVAPFSRVAASGGATTALPMLGTNAAGNQIPLFLPDGKHFVFIGRNMTTGSTYLGSLDGGAAVRLTSDASTNTPAYLPSGWLLWIRAGGALVAQRLDVARGALVGETVSLADGVLSVSASATGVVAYRVSGGQRQLTWVDRSGAVRGTVGPPDGSLLAPRVSPDGRQVAFSRETQGKPDIWLQDDVRASRMTFGSGASTYPVWSPDGSRLAFLSGAGDNPGFYQKPTNGAQAQSLLLSRKVQYLSSWSADGQYLLYFSLDPGSAADLWVLPMTGTRKPFAFLQSSFNKVWGQYSPDGHWVAYQSNESGRNEIYVRRFVVPGDTADSTVAQAGQWQVSTAGGVFPTWRADGKELFFLNPAGIMMAAPITVTGSTVVPGTPVTLFQTKVLGGGIDTGLGRQYDVAPDGRFMINRVVDAAVSPITLILNWNPEAKP